MCAFSICIAHAQTNDARGAPNERSQSSNEHKSRRVVCVREYGAVEQPLPTQTADSDSGNCWTPERLVQDRSPRRAVFVLGGPAGEKNGRRHSVSGG